MRSLCATCGKLRSHNLSVECYDCWKITSRRRREAEFGSNFWARVDATGDCWQWTGYCTQLGYGRLKTPWKTANAWAHRVSYELLVGPIPEGMVIDHLCRNPPCVNPDHLEPVTSRENTRRGVPAIPTQCCKRGHDWTEENTFPKPAGGRECRICRNEARRARYKRLHPKEASAS